MIHIFLTYFVKIKRDFSKFVIKEKKIFALLFLNKFLEIYITFQLKI